MKTALQKIEDQALQEIKDYSTGKRYFVSKFQDSVRKRNIKAKKKLIGYGNEDALSGVGAMEEEKETHRLDKEYDLDALKKGTKIEMEHEKGISDKKRAHDMAEKTAKDHLDEDPKYYEKLAKIEEHIVKQGSKWCLKSKKTNKNLGCYPTKAGAKKREKQVQYFKHMKESIELDEGILQWLGLTKQEEKEQYQDYNQPIQDVPLWIGAFPLKQMDEAKKKFDVIILMANDVVDLAQRFQSQKYEQYKTEGFIVDKYAIQDVETDPGGEDQKIKDAGKLALSLIAPQDKQEPKKVLITCAQGLNRSAAATCLTLQGLGISAQDAYNAIQTSRTAKKQALEFLKASEQNRRAKKLGNQAFMLHGVPHARFLKLVGIDTDKLALQEKIRKLVAQVLKEAYTTNTRKRS